MLLMFGALCAGRLVVGIGFFAIDVVEQCGVERGFRCTLHRRRPTGMRDAMQQSEELREQEHLRQQQRPSHAPRRRLQCRQAPCSGIRAKAKCVQRCGDGSGHDGRTIPAKMNGRRGQNGIPAIPRNACAEHVGERELYQYIATLLHLRAPISGRRRVMTSVHRGNSQAHREAIRRNGKEAMDVTTPHASARIHRGSQPRQGLKNGGW